MNDYILTAVVLALFACITFGAIELIVLVQTAPNYFSVPVTH